MSSEQQENDQFKDLNNRSNLTQFSSKYHPQDSQGINLYFLVLRLSLKRIWWTLSASVLIAFLGTWSYLKLTPKIYVARVSYEVIPLNPVNLQQRNDEGRIVDLEEEFLNQRAIKLFQKN